MRSRPVVCCCLLSVSFLVTLASCNDSNSSSSGPNPTPAALPTPAPGALPPLPPSSGGSGGGAGPAPGCEDAFRFCAIAIDVGAPSALAVDEKWVYFGTESGLIAQVGKDGSGTVALAYKQGKVQNIQVDSSGVYWVGDENVMALPAGSSSPVTLYSGSGDLPALALDASNVYVTSGKIGEVYQISKMGGLEATLVSGESETSGIATDGYAVYWSNPLKGTVAATVLSSGSTTTLSTGEGSPLRVALSPSGGASPGQPNANLFWTNPIPGSSAGAGLREQTILCSDSSCTKIEGGPSQSLSDDSGASALALDAVNAYWSNLSDWSVSEVPIFGGQTEVLASGVPRPSAIASDGGYVYFAADSASAGFIGRLNIS